MKAENGLRRRDRSGGVAAGVGRKGAKPPLAISLRRSEGDDLLRRMMAELGADEDDKPLRATIPTAW